MVYRGITDSTLEIENNLFLKTAQNSKYFKGENFITPKELIKRWELDKIKIIGITGTNGKTTTASLIYSLLLDLDYKVALQGTRGFFCNDKKVGEKTLTTPSIFETIKNLDLAKKEGVEFFIMEVSSHAISQNRIEGLDFLVKVFTNISIDHLDYHKTFENYLNTKLSFFKDESSLKLVNKDSGIDFSFAKGIRTYSIKEMATFIMEAYSKRDTLSGIIAFGSERSEFFSNLIGEFNLYNILAAVGAVKLATERSLKEICKNIINFGGVKGRMEIVSKNPLIIVDFAHTPDGMEKVLNAIEKEKIVVFGAGGNRDRSKREIMGMVADKFAKKIILTIDNPRCEEPNEIIKDILVGIKNRKKVEIILDRVEAIKRGIELIKDEALFILGKGDEEYIEFCNEKIYFSDKKVVEAILDGRG